MLERGCEVSLTSACMAVPCVTYCVVYMKTSIFLTLLTQFAVEVKPTVCGHKPVSELRFFLYSRCGIRIGTPTDLVHPYMHACGTIYRDQHDVEDCHTHRLPVCHVSKATCDCAYDPCTRESNYRQAHQERSAQPGSAWRGPR